jgi:hypothetical protein
MDNKVSHLFTYIYDYENDNDKDDAMMRFTQVEVYGKKAKVAVRVRMRPPTEKCNNCIREYSLLEIVFHLSNEYHSHQLHELISCSFSTTISIPLVESSSH